MFNLSIMPLFKNRIDEICEAVIEQQRTGVATHALFMMTFNPECNPPLNKAEEQCAIYDIYREKLDKAGAKHGVLVQATLGHIVTPREPYPFMPSVSLITGEPRPVTCCPFDPEFHKYIKEQMKILAKRRPSIIMIDDDMGLLYKPTKGCACKHHMAEFNRRAGTNMSREELYKHTQGISEEDKYYTQIYVDVQRDGLVSAAKAMREGIDEIDPTIQGMVSGIYTTTFCEFSGDTARAFAGKGNPAIVRMNGGPYAKETPKYFTSSTFRAAILRENIKDKVDMLIAETDTCPYQRYSTSASMLHAHYTSSILEGAKGAKHWIFRLGNSNEHKSEKAYCKILSKYEKFYEKMAELSKELKPFGCKIPLTLMQNYGFVPSSQPLNLGPWAACILERLGLPLYFSNEEGGAVFLDDFSVDGFDDETIKKFMSKTLILSAGAAKKLVERGFSEYMGVEVNEWDEKLIAGGECVNGNFIAGPYDKKEIKMISEKTEELSFIHRRNTKTGKFDNLAPGSTRFDNSFGGEVIVFAANPDMPYKYFTAFSMLCEARKEQFVEILSRRDNIPLYYTEDCEVYLRAGYLPNGEMMGVFFNIGLDQLDEISIKCTKKVTKIEKLDEKGNRVECKFKEEDGNIIVEETLNTLIPVVLFIS